MLVQVHINKVYWHFKTGIGRALIVVFSYIFWIRFKGFP